MAVPAFSGGALLLACCAEVCRRLKSGNWSRALDDAFLDSGRDDEVGIAIVEFGVPTDAGVADDVIDYSSNGDEQRLECG